MVRWPAPGMIATSAFGVSGSLLTYRIGARLIELPAMEKHGHRQGSELGRAILTLEGTGNGEVRRPPHMFENLEVGVHFGKRAEQRLNCFRGQLPHDVCVDPLTPCGSLIARCTEIPSSLRFGNGGLCLGRQLGHQCAHIFYPPRCAETRAREYDAGNLNGALGNQPLHGQCRAPGMSEHVYGAGRQSSANEIEFLNETFKCPKARVIGAIRSATIELVPGKDRARIAQCCEIIEIRAAKPRGRTARPSPHPRRPTRRGTRRWRAVADCRPSAIASGQARASA